MANQLQDTINYVIPFCRYQAANVGVNNMPIIGIANIVRNIILAAPFTWRFNRNSLNLTGPVVKGTEDYTQTVPDFGFIEKATANDGTRSFQIPDVKNNEALGTSAQVNTPATGRPQSIAVQNDDGAGNITFRLSAVPDNSYTVNIVYQKAPVQFTATTDKWAPIPDSFSDVYNNLCLGYYMDSCQDPRAPQYIARGIAGLLARAQGLTHMDKMIFAASYMQFNASQMLEILKTQQGQQAQGTR
jgi:hypothetical protein